MAAKLELAIAMATISRACEPWHLDPKIHDQLELELDVVLNVTVNRAIGIVGNVGRRWKEC